jgi:hypothetical protein
VWDSLFDAQGRDEKCILIGKCEGKRPSRRARDRWEDNMKMVPNEIG